MAENWWRFAGDNVHQEKPLLEKPDNSLKILENLRKFAKIPSYLNNISFVWSLFFSLKLPIILSKFSTKWAHFCSGNVG